MSECALDTGTGDNASLTHSKHKTVEFVWKIDHFKTRHYTDRWLDSNRFLTHENGYSMQLRFLPNGLTRNIRLSIYPNCVKGFYDRALPWPFRCQVTMGITDKAANEFLVSDSRIFEYFTPHHSKVQPFTFTFEGNTMVHDDCLVVKCTTTVLK